jgi:hypothetical protein
MIHDWDESAFQVLTPEGVEGMKEWARKNFEPNFGEDDFGINGAWHPVCRAECLRMVAEAVESYSRRFTIEGVAAGH